MCTRWFGFVLCVANYIPRGKQVREFTPPYKVSVGDGGAMFRPHIRAAFYCQKLIACRNFYRLIFEIKGFD